MTTGSMAPGRPPVVGDPETYESWIGRFLETQEASLRRALLAEVAARPDVEALLSLLKEESLRYLSVDPHRSLALAEGLIECASLAGRPDHGALGLMAKGDALRYIGRFPESIALLDEAGAAFLDRNDEVGWARTRIGWLISAHRLGRAQEALAVVEHARDVLIRHHEWLRAGGLDLNTAVVCQDLGLFDRALALYERAERTYLTIGAGAGPRAIWAKANKAILLTLLGEFDQALALHEDVYAALRQRGEAMPLMEQQENIAAVYAGQGHFTRALHLLGEALGTARAAGLEANAASITLNLVECYLSLNRHGDAAELAQDAVERYRRCGAPIGAARAQYLLALALGRQGQTARALALLDEAAESFAAAGLARQKGLATLQRGALLFRAGREAEAWDVAAVAHALFGELGLELPRAQAGIVMARAAVALDRAGEAERLARSALDVTRARGVLWLAHEAHHVIGAAARSRGDLASARASYDSAVRSIERAQSRLATELRSTFLDDKLQVYEDAIDCSLRLGEPRRALGYLEAAKSRALVDYLARYPELRPRAPSADDQPLVDELARLRGEHNWFYERVHGRDFAVRDANEEPPELGALRAGLVAREREIERILERLALNRADREPPPADSVGPPDPPDGAALTVIPPLDPETVLVEYFFGRERSVVFVVAGGRVTAVPLEAGERAVTRALDKLQLNLSSAARSLAGHRPLTPLVPNARGVLESLYRALLQPVAKWLRGRRRLVVIPYGASHAVPFHALHDGERWLLERMEVTVCPSSELLRLCAGRRRPSRHSALVVAHSDGGRLGHVLREADAVGAMMPGERYAESEATRAALTEAAPRHGVIHLAAHGEARLDNPTFAHIKLADGQLSTADVFNLPLDGALVTLSACETGRAVVRGGDELIGLSRGFLHAGVSTLIQSLWRVEDAATAELMALFYRGLREGAPPAAALRSAQLAFLEERDGDDSRSSDRSHPLLWAPFQVVGDGGDHGGGTHVEAA